MNRIRTAALALTAGIVVLTGWTGTVDGAVASTASHASASVIPASTGTITITNYRFYGPRILARHALVTVRNRDNTAHTVTVNRGHAFNVVVGAHKTVTFRAPRTIGTYRFHCAIHPDMHGVLTVR